MRVTCPATKFLLTAALLVAFLLTARSTAVACPWVVATSGTASCGPWHDEPLTVAVGQTVYFMGEEHNFAQGDPDLRWWFYDDGSGWHEAPNKTGNCTYSTTGEKTAWYKVRCEPSGLEYNDSCTVWVVKVDLAIEDVDEADEETVGAVVVRNYDNNSAPRKKITLLKADPSSWTGNVILSRSNSKVKVYDAASGGNEITFQNNDNKFANSILPKDLWVEGYTASDSMRDISLELYVDGNPSINDTVKFTVLWVTVTTDHGGTLETDNAARDYYSNTVVPPPDYTLGYHVFCEGAGYDPEGGWMARGSEFVGDVEPDDFVPSQFGGSMNLAREDMGGYHHWGPNGNEYWDPTGGGSDTSEWEQRDDDPQSGGSSGKIYDWDAPGLGAVFEAELTRIERLRINYEEWAVYGGIRCSEEKEWYTRQSYMRTGSLDTGTATGAGTSTLTDDTKEWDEDTWAPGIITITSGDAAGQYRRVTGNTEDTITVAESWGTQPPSGSGYIVINTSTWEPWDDVEDDNENGDGTTNTSWDLE